MLGLNLRPEFRSKRISGTMIELSNAQNTGCYSAPCQLNYLKSAIRQPICYLPLKR